MCGITGFFNPSGLPPVSATAVIQSMADRMTHRGPDDVGVWVDGDAGVSLGHCRLSILDLSPAGHQPMVSASGRYVIVFNGEIYNHQELRAELLTNWRGHSDTETLLSGFDCWGIEATLKKTVGMFAFALWDRENRILTLGRDRMGEKPLYYGWQGDTFLFGSELKALKAHPAFRSCIDRNVLTLYLRHGYIPAPHSIYHGIYKLPPGTFLQIPAQQGGGDITEPTPFWSLLQVVEAGLADPFEGTEKEAVAALESRMMQAVSQQQIADVPLGAFLSGGIDSSTVVAIMQAQSSRPVKTFTIGFREQDYNEAKHAKAVAKHLGTDHTELYVNPRDAMDVIPKLATLYDEPFGDSSAIPTYMVSQLARQYVKVSLSGDGGDELFGGYSRYQRSQKVWKAMQRMPRIARHLVTGGAKMLPADCLNLLLRPIQSSRQLPGDRVKALAMLLSAESFENFYRVQVSQWKDPSAIVTDGVEPLTVMTDPKRWLTEGQLFDRMMYIDAMSYLPDDILVKVDRAAMGTSLETRVPMLDHRLVDLAWRLPLHMKVRDGQGKWLLRQLLYKYVPKALIDRPKMGFGVPVGQWICGALRDWAEDLLSEQRLKNDGIFECEILREFFKQHLEGTVNRSDSLWIILSFQAWLKDNE